MCLATNIGVIEEPMELLTFELCQLDFFNKVYTTSFLELKYRVVLSINPFHFLSETNDILSSSWSLYRITPIRSIRHFKPSLVTLQFLIILPIFVGLLPCLNAENTYLDKDKGIYRESSIFHSDKIIFCVFLILAFAAGTCTCLLLIKRRNKASRNHVYKTGLSVEKSCPLV